ncbi:MAG: rhodanese-like domain protein [Wigglesworthia glossinidia]|nr:rhodanese-like domain protein [Wigglesworthia glossinidia]
MGKLIQFASNHTILSLIWLSLLILLLINFIRNKINNMLTISRYETISLMNRNHAMIIDLRNQKEYCNEHIINSFNLNLCHIKNDIFYKKNNTKKILILVCDNGKLSKKILKKINKIEQSKNFKIYILEDGITGWKLDNLPLVKS